MIKTFIATETDGLDVTNLVMTVDIPDEIDFETAAIEAAKEYCRTPEGKAQYRNNCNCFNWGDFDTYVPDEICKKHGFSKITSYVSSVFNFDQQLVDDDDVFAEDEDETRNYIIDNLSTNEEIVALGYHENDAFIDDVVARYNSNLSCCDEDYSEINAKDDAIASALNFWKEMNNME